MDDEQYTPSRLAPAPKGLVTALADGRRVLLRPIRPDDKAGLHRAMTAMSSVARRHRFFSGRQELDEEMVAYLTEIDYRSHFAWVALAWDRPGRPIVGVGRYIAMGTQGDPATAEIAVAVGDDYQRQGLATMFLELLSIVARANGIRGFHAQVMEDNLAMRHLLVGHGARMALAEAGVLQTTIDVPAATPRFDLEVVTRMARAAADGRI